MQSSSAYRNKVSGKRRNVTPDASDTDGATQITRFPFGLRTLMSQETLSVSLVIKAVTASYRNERV